MTTITQLKTNLDKAHSAYLAASIEHPTELILAKDGLSNARHEYWYACAEFVTRLQAAKTENEMIGLALEVMQ